MAHFKQNRLYVYAFWGALFFERSIWINYLQHQGYSTVQIGFLQTLLTLAMFIFEFPSGVLSDRLGAKKVMNIGHILIIIYLLALLLNLGYVSLIIGFVAYGAGLSMISGSDQTLIYQTNPEQSYQHKIGIFEAITIIGLTVSSMIGGYLTTISWQSIFIIEILTQALSIFLLLFINKESDETDPDDDEELMSINDMFIELFSILKLKEIRYLIITISLFQSSISALLNFAQMLFSAKHLTPFTSATILTIALALSAVASVSIEKISQRIGTKRAISIFLGITLISFAMIKGEYFITLLIAYFAIEFSFEFVDTSLNAVVQDASNDQIRTSLISSVNTLTAGLMFLETIIITSLFSRFGVIDSFVVYGIVAVILTGISFIAFMYQQRKANNNN